MGLELRTFGHATLAVGQKDGEAAGAAPVLITDPWLLGSCYWRSWWLSNPPTAAEIDWLASARYVFLTHEHPDHLHPPSLRRLKQVAPEGALQILTPDFPSMQMDAYLTEQGFAVRRVPPSEWAQLEGGVQIMSLPVVGNDSILLIDTPGALIINQNDAKPGARALTRLGAMTKRLAKPKVVLRSHSPAGPGHAYFRNGERLSVFERGGPARSARSNALAFGADFFVPFASQAVFLRRESMWANDFRIDYKGLQDFWRRARPALLPPYVTLDLETFDWSAPPQQPDLPTPAPAAAARIEEMRERDQNERLSDQDLDRLRDILGQERLAIAAILPRGLVFAAGSERLRYDAKTGRLTRLPSGETPEAPAVVSAPAAAFRDAIQYGHIADLFISMLLEIHLDGRTSHRRIELLYRILTLRDYGYAGDVRRLRHLFWAWRRTSRPPPAPPALS